jgi:hypothetical protein
MGGSRREGWLGLGLLLVVVFGEKGVGLVDCVIDAACCVGFVGVHSTLDKHGGTIREFICFLQPASAPIRCSIPQVSKSPSHSS